MNEWTGRGLAWLTLLMVLAMFFIVVMRYAFDWGSIAFQESVIYMHAIVLMLGAAYTLKHGGHVRVDIFYRQASNRRQGWVDTAGLALLLIPTGVFIFWVSWDYVAASWSLREASREAGGLPIVYLLKSLMLLAALLLLLQSLSELTKAWAKARS